MEGGDKNKETVLQTLLEKMVDHFNRQGVCYALLGEPSGKNLLTNDLDICADNIQKFEQALNNFCDHEDIIIINKTHHAEGIRYDLVCHYADEYLFFPGPDLLIFPTWHIRGDIGLSYFNLLQHRILNQRGFYTPNTEDAFIFYLIKRVDKGEIGQKQGEYLSTLWERNPNVINGKLKNIFSSDNAQLIVSAAESRCWDNVVMIIPILKNELLAQKKICLRRYLWITKRMARRIFCPTGVFVVSLGPDGSGKSTMIDTIVSTLSPAFRNTRKIHLRPELGCKKNSRGTPVTDPHGKPARGMLSSIAKIFYFVYDYGLGYLFKIRPLLVRSTFVVFDRYYHDLLVDPKRYRYGGPMWLAKAAAFFIPSPDLFVILDAPPEVLQKRKQEVSWDESCRQRQAYNDLADYLPNAVRVDAAKPLADVTNEVAKNILELMKDRTRRQLHR